MGMTFVIQYAEEVVKEDIPKLSSDVKKRIRVAIEKKLTTEPEKFGKPLRKSLKGYRKLRVGNYRVIFRIEKKLIKIFAIGHRSVIYGDAQKRLN
ncbi:type II toxin-antitoxin system RelE/ParE family toxin [Candidatus Peregrinibacteria bacterium]|jgi:mRNA interferase RelE/StbE|nr:type II toxin-antitoxin system RelE/ParE family toxin [Candidatus Peregrinibacteria bacterium]MBT4632263.1 type II toxin-antitoxin system RelE/ParE family toxin [Candidatus Peregrinibacteria bacterium]MBT5824326.1 type II toxin-antitoxin system RelE/ParE family toxin [Candidatus Peregrinibacteria bacterium]